MNYEETYIERLARLTVEIREALRERKKDEAVRFSHAGTIYDMGDRTRRMDVVRAIADEYVSAHADVIQRNIVAWVERGGKGERPVSLRLDANMLDRLTNAVLDEELTDMLSNKVSTAEYPFLSEAQFDRRRDHEYSLSLADSYDLDGVNRAKPERRHRIAKEERFIDKVSRNKNRARNAQYKRDTSAGPLVTYNLRDNGGELAPDFVTAATTAEVWRERLSLVY